MPARPPPSPDACHGVEVHERAGPARSVPHRGDGRQRRSGLVLRVGSRPSRLARGVQLGARAGRPPDLLVLGADPVEVLLGGVRRDPHAVGHGGQLQARGVQPQGVELARAQVGSVRRRARAWPRGRPTGTARPRATVDRASMSAP